MKRAKAKKGGGMNKTKRKDVAPAAPQHSGPEWVESMQAHFQQTGYYRAKDLNRLLGDPRVSVGISSDDGVKVVSLVAPQ
jgi:hypothetical protein